MQDSSLYLQKPEPKVNISQPSVSELTITMEEDISSPFLFHSAVNRGLWPELTIVTLSPFGKPY